MIDYKTFLEKYLESSGIPYEIIDDDEDTGFPEIIEVDLDDKDFKYLLISWNVYCRSNGIDSEVKLVNKGESYVEPKKTKRK